MTLGKIKSKKRNIVPSFLRRKEISTLSAVRPRKRRIIYSKFNSLFTRLKSSSKVTKLAVYTLIWVSICFVGSGFIYLENQFEGYLDKVSAKEFAGLNGVNILEDALVLGESTQVQQQKPKNIKSTFKSLDKRAYVLEEYIRVRNSPLIGMGRVFVEACDRYGAPRDCLSTIAIARHETDLCKYYYSAEMRNCMGWGGGGEYRMRFNSFEDHINIATDVLVNQYGPQYMNDPRLMEKVFCGPQDECIGWGARVLRIMNEIDDFGVSLGVGRLSELR